MPSDEKPSILFGSTMFGIVLLVVISWIIVGGVALGLSSLYAGFLFLWYWGEVEGAEMDRFFTSLCGAVCGIGLAWMLKLAPDALGSIGIAISLGILLIAVYIHILKRLPFALNSAAMLFLTVGSAPAIFSQSDFGEVMASLGAGAVFFGCVVFALKWIISRSNAAPASE